jgi:hypothetical protein
MALFLRYKWVSIALQVFPNNQLGNAGPVGVGKNTTPQEPL